MGTKATLHESNDTKCKGISVDIQQAALNCDVNYWQKTAPDLIMASAMTPPPKGRLAKKVREL